MLGQGLRGASSPSVNGRATMKRVQDIAWPVIGLGAVAVSSWLLFKELRGLSYASLRDAFGSISAARWVMAGLSTALAYSALAWYDRIALLHLGRKIGWPFVALTSFVTYALAHNLGASVFSGAVVRRCSAAPAQSRVGPCPIRQCRSGACHPPGLPCTRGRSAHHGRRAEAQPPIDRDSRVFVASRRRSVARRRLATR